MKKSSFILTAFLCMAAICFTACKKDYTDSGKGYKYKYFKEGSGKTPKFGDYILTNIIYYNGKDSILRSSLEDGMPFIMRYDSAMKERAGEFYKINEMLKEGDSIEIVTTAGWFFKDIQSQIPPFLTSEEEFKIRIGVVSITDEDGLQAYLDRKAEDQYNKELNLINNYISENGIQAEKTETGLFVSVMEQGTGEMAQAGDTVSVHYTGSLLDGTKFDSSVDRGEPIKFPLGRGMVIQGWDEGLTHFGKGGKGKLLIPSKLGYGQRGSAPVIKPNSILVFDVEIVDIIKNN